MMCLLEVSMLRIFCVPGMSCPWAESLSGWAFPSLLTSEVGKLAVAKGDFYFLL